MSIDRTRRLESSLPVLFDELANARTPDYLEDAIERASTNTQRPAWTFPTRWLPMEIVTTRVPLARLPWRQIGVLALLAIVLLTMVALLAGSPPTRVPEPFGPAGNGLIAVEQNTDLYTVDPHTGEMKLLVGGPENDQWLDFTPDGTRGVFLRWGPDGPMQTAEVGTVPMGGGAKPVFIKKDVIHGDSLITLAPNGRDIAFTAPDYNAPVLMINVAALDGTRYRQYTDVPITDYGGLEYLAPNGEELVYLARSSDGSRHDIRALNVASGQTRPIFEPAKGDDIFGNVSAAPDGKHVAFALKAVGGGIAVHVVGTDGKDDRVVGHLPGATFEAWPQWDPQGHRLLIERKDALDAVHPVIVDLDGAPDVAIQTSISENGAGKLWSPDGASILAQRTAADGQQLQQELWNATTGKVTPVGWPSTTPPLWQRVAPAP
jgi:dipeptidyl aminopeptidase/acylaminoacyl peptidase